MTNSADKRSIATDALEVAGLVIPPDKQVGRDAVHMAVLPVVTADGWVKPGAHVGLNPDGRASVMADKMIGIIDPFLTANVPRGTRVLLWLYPRTISSLRHVWSHPDVPEEVTVPRLNVDEIDLSKWKIAPPGFSTFTPIGEAAQKVVDGLQKAWIPQTEDDLIRALHEFSGTVDEGPVTGRQLYEAMDGDGYVTVGVDVYGQIGIPMNLWEAFEKIKGRRAINDPRNDHGEGVHFTCSC